MTDNVTALKQQRNDELASQVAATMKAEGLSQAAAAQLIGVHKTRFNQWLKGSYRGDNSQVESAANRWLESRRQNEALNASLPAAPDWVETPSARAVISALGFAQMASTISVIYGGAGVGKTEAVSQYRQQSPNVWVATATPATSAPGPILTRIAQVLGIRATGAVHMIETNIIERLRDSRGLLVIDEAQHLNPRALDQIRQIAEGAGIGLALVGNEIVYTQLTGGNRSIGFAQLFSRVAKRVRLSRPKAGDIDALLDAWTISDAASRTLGHEIGKRPGALRGLSQTLRLASLFASGKPSVTHIRAAWKDLGGDV